MTRTRIYFVDDEPSVLAGLKRMLRPRRHEWEMAFFTSGPKALEAIRNAPCSVLVSDLAMPEMTGLELAREVKMLAPAAQIIILTGTADLQTAIQAINGFEIFRFYTKPCEHEELVAGIEAAMPEFEIQSRNSAETPTVTGGIGEAALAKLPLGVVVTDPAGRVEFMNPRAAEIVTRGDGLLVGGDGVLRAEKTSDSNTLREHISRVCSADSDGDNEALAIARPSMLRPFSVLITLMADSTASPRAVLFLTDPEAQPSVSAKVIAELFGLTESESRLVQALAAGQRLEDAAAHVGLTLSSARTYLKQVFSKTDTRRQAELVQLVLTSPAILDSQKMRADGV